MPKILIVDDEPNIVTLISRYAQREGYDIVTASDGREAIDKSRSEDFDVIIMDVMMPDTDGFTACKKDKGIQGHSCYNALCKRYGVR